MDEARRGFRELAHAIVDHGHDATNVNRSVRTNIVIAGNAGDSNATRSASATQSIRVRQRDGETVEESRNEQR